MGVGHRLTFLLKSPVELLPAHSLVDAFALHAEISPAPGQSPFQVNQDLVVRRAHDADQRVLVLDLAASQAGSPGLPAHIRHRRR